MYTLGHVPSHKGCSTTTDPIKGADVNAIKELLKYKPRDAALWAVATNCALRAGDLLNLKWSDIKDDGERYSIRLIEQKTKKHRLIVLNSSVSETLRAWQSFSTSEYVFSGQRGKLTVATLGRMCKQWAKDVGLNAQVASHSLRKTWCRAMVDVYDEPLFKMMWALGHSSERQTAQYIGLLTDEVAGLYEHVV